MSEDSKTDAILTRCQDLGFADASVAPASTVPRPDALIRWLSDGRHGEMTWLESYLAQRIDPRKTMPEAKSIICVADRYAGGEAGVVDPTIPRHGRIARYARGDDYHRIIKKRLHELCDELARDFPDEKFRACVDTAPVLERAHAARAGLGYIGKNTLLIEPGVGSYLLLGEIITTLQLEPHRTPLEDHCGTCTRCLDACPTDALTPYELDATRCLSYLTIEHRSEIDEQFFGATGDWLFGCDICQEVCPHNGETEPTISAEVHPAYTPRRQGFDLLEVLGWTEDDRRDAFTRSAMKRAKLWMMKRNALIVAGNWLNENDDGELRDRVREIAADPDEHDVVRATAQQVLSRL